MFGYANPAKFMKLSGVILPFAGAGSVLLMLAGLYYALLASPPDAEMSENVRIMYIHVPSAWMAMFAYMFMAGASLFGFVWRHHLADMAAKSAAPVGAAFTALCLVTGSLWGIRGWGTWWVWDARLTSVLILFFMYLGYIALWEAIEDKSRAARATAILAIVGVIMIPIIKFSVEWWNTLHQPASVTVTEGIKIDPSMRTPLFLMAFGFQLFFIWVVLVRMRTEVLARRLHALHTGQARGEKPFEGEPAHN